MNNTRWFALSMAVMSISLAITFARAQHLQGRYEYAAQEWGKTLDLADQCMVGWSAALTAQLPARGREMTKVRDALKALADAARSATDARQDTRR